MDSTEQIKAWEALALKAGFERNGDNLLPPSGAICIDPELMRFAAAVAEAEREACAKLCEDDENGFSIEGKWCASAIRERSNIQIEPRR